MARVPMMRIARTDANQAALVEIFRAAGATVQPLHAVGRGCPDLLVGYRGMNLLVEVKDGAKAVSAQRLTRDQRHWHAAWVGQIDVVNSAAQAKLLLAWVDRKCGP